MPNPYGNAPSGLQNTQKQQALTAYRTDYWMLKELIEGTTNPELKRAYAILLGLVDSSLKELEEK